MTDIMVGLVISMIANVILVAVNNYLIYTILMKHKKENEKKEYNK